MDLLLNTMYVLYIVFSTYLGMPIFLYKEKDGELIFLHPWERIYAVWLCWSIFLLFSRIFLHVFSNLHHFFVYFSVILVKTD